MAFKERVELGQSKMIDPHADAVRLPHLYPLFYPFLFLSPTSNSLNLTTVILLHNGSLPPGIPF